MIANEQTDMKKKASRKYEGLLTQPFLMVDENKGIYIPMEFLAELTEYNHRVVKNAHEWAVETIGNGPDHEHYWDAWNEILSDEYKFMIGNGRTQTFSLYQDGDLWCIPKIATKKTLREFFGVEFLG